MKKNMFRFNLFLAVFALFVVSCSDSIEPLDTTMGDNEEELVNDENSTDDTDDGDNSDSGNSGDDSSNDDTTGGEDGNSGDDSSNDDTSGGNDGNNDDTSGDDASNDDSTGDDSSDMMIIGSWRLVSAVINDGQASTVFNGIPVSFPFTSTSQDENVDVTFQENPNVVTGTGQYTNVIQFNIGGNDFSEETTFDSPLTDGNWVMNNNELTISGSSQANGTFLITELTSSTLVLQTDFEQTVPTGDLELETTGVLVIQLARN